jgi:ERCC4-type nuclease
MLISPAEPKTFKHLGKSSPIPERYGADFLFLGKTFGAVGVQRKELSDLLQSIRDGRLGKELNQMKALGQGVLLIEGKIQWTEAGMLLLARSSWTKAQHLGLLWSIQSRGYWIGFTETQVESMSYLSLFGKWLEKAQHRSLTTRPNVDRGMWGHADHRDWGIHFLQGFEGVGFDRAAAIYDYFGGVPLIWETTEQELVKIEGIGTKTAKNLILALGSLRESISENAD